MIDRCPCCNARLKEAVSCPRCQADLNGMIAAEKSAELWLSKAIENLLDSNTEQSIAAINRSLQLKKTAMAEQLRGFLIQQQCKNILDLLAQAQIIPAKKALYQARSLMPYSQQLQILDTFANYKLFNK